MAIHSYFPRGSWTFSVYRLFRTLQGFRDTDRGEISRGAPCRRVTINIIFGRILYVQKEMSRATADISLAYKKEARETNDVSAHQYIYIYKKKRTTSFLSPRSNYLLTQLSHIFIYILIYIYI